MYTCIIIVQTKTQREANYRLISKKEKYSFLYAHLKNMTYYGTRAAGGQRPEHLSAQ